MKSFPVPPWPNQNCPAAPTKGDDYSQLFNYSGPNPPLTPAALSLFLEISMDTTSSAWKGK
jgi:hypothetical protein